MFRASSSRISKRVVSNKRYNSQIPPPQAGAAEAVSENFASPIWRNSLAFGVLSYAIYKFDQAYASNNDNQGYFASLINYYRTKEGLWETGNVRHYDLAKEAAETRILLASAKAPALHQLRYPAALDHGSPYNRRVDHIVDTSNVQVKKRDEVATAGAKESVL